MKEYEELTEIICFHCQQAVEKYLKAILIWKEELNVPKTYNIDLLLTICAKFDKRFLNYTGNELTSYAVDLRYPDTLYIPTSEEMQTALNITNSIIAIAKEILSIK